MRDRGADVVFDQPVVQLEIVAGCVGQHPLIERSSLVPEPSHAAPSCSLGLKALRSATTKVPVPSLVKISASRLSVDLYVITCTRRTPPRIAFSMAVALGSMPSFKWPASHPPTFPAHAPPRMPAPTVSALMLSKTPLESADSGLTTGIKPISSSLS